MNIAFFLTPKSDLVYEKINSTMRQAVERMEYHRFTAIPLIDDLGRYVGTLTEGDLLWKIKNTDGLDFKNTEKIKLTEVQLRVIHKSVSINADMEDLLSLAIHQNFVPVEDDNGIFIGIIKRGDIIDYFFNNVCITEEKFSFA